MNMHHKPVVMGELILRLGEVQISARPSTRYSAQYQEAYRYIYKFGRLSCAVSVLVTVDVQF
jgi:hypothetical protein